MELKLNAPRGDATVSPHLSFSADERPAELEAAVLKRLIFAL
jgi:hypothetical protein